MRGTPRVSEGLREVFVDLHVHLGWAGDPGGDVKISAARDLTLSNILYECRARKGIDMIGVIDAATTGALADLERLMAMGEVVELSGGGLAYGGEVTLIPGAEVEVAHPVGGRAVHLLCFVRGVRELRELAAWQRGRVRNPALSSQRHHHTSAADVVTLVAGLGGFVIPAHIFTPHKAILAAAPRICDVIAPQLWGHVAAVELGLSSDTALADELPELSHFCYVTNSDAHSLSKIGREYNLLHLVAPTFDELLMALRAERGRRVLANYGLEPRLGQYHRTFCLNCGRRLAGDPPVTYCEQDRRHRLVLGVLDRIYLYRAAQTEIARCERIRPPYIHQVPLQFVPGLGRQKMAALLAAFGTEMAILHRTAEDELAAVVGPKLAGLIMRAREGLLEIEAGAGGTYGKILR